MRERTPKPATIPSQMEYGGILKYDGGHSAKSVYITFTNSIYQDYVNLSFGQHSLEAIEELHEALGTVIKHMKNPELIEQTESDIQTIRQERKKLAEAKRADAMLKAEAQIKAELKASKAEKLKQEKLELEKTIHDRAMEIAKA